MIKLRHVNTRTKRTFDSVHFGATFGIDQVRNHIECMLYRMYLVLVSMYEETRLPDGRKLIFG